MCKACYRQKKNREQEQFKHGYKVFPLVASLALFLGNEIRPLVAIRLADFWIFVENGTPGINDDKQN
ncbi:hypothetical protein TSAR_000240 [Trichomalopsis sarcophagae]|uniref:Uncharacterized protein n=1 Tax=Trichomalopsis sarcophagae TaxID=543379 RepID=A0A232F1K5_9HYME|nr:hypothetical protein TSAR_000240 [Trichomalopsis sarcophagae]